MDAFLSAASSAGAHALAALVSLEERALWVLASRAQARGAGAAAAPPAPPALLEQLLGALRRVRPLELASGLLSLAGSIVLLRLLRQWEAQEGQEGQDAAPTLLPPPPSAPPGAPPQAVALTALEASLLRACTIALPPLPAGADAFASVGGQEAALARLQEQAVLPLRSPALLAHSALLQAPSGVLLFGPPGTGKTLLARCLAQSTRARFLSLSASTLQNMYVGQSARLVTAAFSLARKIAPCIMFFDELDGLLPRRDGSSGLMSSHTHEFITSFLSAWEGVGSGGGGGGGGKWVLVVAASNRPGAIDAAALRRLPCQLEVALPDARGREDILRVLLRGERCEAGGGVAAALAALAEQAEGYSGSDLREVVKAAALLPVQEALEGGGAGAGGGKGGEEGEEGEEGSEGGAAAAEVRGITAGDLWLALDRVRPAEEKPMAYLKRTLGGR